MFQSQQSCWRSLLLEAVSALQRVYLSPLTSAEAVGHTETSPFLHTTYFALKWDLERLIMLYFCFCGRVRCEMGPQPVQQH